jgi:hypothetical protein
VVLKREVMRVWFESSSLFVRGRHAPAADRRVRCHLMVAVARLNFSVTSPADGSSGEIAVF